METLKSLGYVVNSEYQLRHVDTGKPFAFTDQKRYEEIGDAVAECIQQLMVEKYSMLRIELPLLNECPVFLSSNASASESLLILLCGSGTVAAGQWARKLCINDSFKTGSVLPFLEWANERGIAVLVLNPNMGLKNISSTGHVIYAWDEICKKHPAKHIAVVAHSFGGVDACGLLKWRGNEMLARLRCIAFTDSVHSIFDVKQLAKAAQHFIRLKCKNWASSTAKLDTQIRSQYGDCVCVSAGTTVHEETTMAAFDSICNFLSNALQRA